jgi:hypothetical protein
MAPANNPVAALLPLLIFIPFLFVGLALMVFWIWMLVDCATKEPSTGNDKIIWILIIVFTHWIGALIYFLVRRPERKKLFGV